MHTVGAFEAKTHLSQLLERVSRGERITIEKHGVPVAVLQPVDATRVKHAGEVGLRVSRCGRWPRRGGVERGAVCARQLGGYGVVF
jgi:prevent-host-death family protein